MKSRNCGNCSAQIIPVIDFGDMPLANSFRDPTVDNSYRFRMSTGFCTVCLLFQLIEFPSAEQMFNVEYPFFTGLSQGMVKHFELFAQDTLKFVPENGLVIEIGSNDGTLLNQFAKRKRRVLGIEPSMSAASRAQALGIPTMVEFLSNEVGLRIQNEYGKADLIVAANVICHIPDLSSVFEPVKDLLSPQGIFAFEEPYLLDMLDNVSYDQIYDEHVYIFSIGAVSKIAQRFGLQLIDAIPQSTHGGSMRYILAHVGTHESEIKSQLLEQESNRFADPVETMEYFTAQVIEKTRELKELIKLLRSEGKRVCGYAATSKSTTILNYSQLGPNDIEYIVDLTPEKIGKLAPGSNIPIISREDALANPPDYFVLFAWNHKEEVMQRENEFTQRGIKWINWAPRVKVET